MQWLVRLCRWRMGIAYVGIQNYTYNTSSLAIHYSKRTVPYLWVEVSVVRWPGQECASGLRERVQQFGKGRSMVSFWMPACIERQWKIQCVEPHYKHGQRNCLHTAGMNFRLQITYSCVPTLLEGNGWLINEMCWTVVAFMQLSGTSDKGHSENGTTSL